jgi:hypothetical protein
MPDRRRSVQKGASNQDLSVNSHSVNIGVPDFGHQNTAPTEFWTLDRQRRSLVAVNIRHVHNLKVYLYHASLLHIIQMFWHTLFIQEALVTFCTGLRHLINSHNFKIDVTWFHQDSYVEFDCFLLRSSLRHLSTRNVITASNMPLYPLLLDIWICHFLPDPSLSCHSLATVCVNCLLPMYFLLITLFSLVPTPWQRTLHISLHLSLCTEHTGPLEHNIYYRNDLQ